MCDIVWVSLQEHYYQCVSLSVWSDKFGPIFSRMTQYGTGDKNARYGRRSFAVSGLTVRNSLPPTVRDPSLTLMQFCSPCYSVQLMKRYCSASVTV